jgi:hypothetical protein
MKIKLNLKQIETIRKQLEETDRKKYDTSDISQVFRMLQYWSKCIGGDETKIKSVTELPDGFLCRVNSQFRDSMKAFLRQARPQRAEEEIEDSKQGSLIENVQRYERLIKEAEKRHPRQE